MNKLIKTSLLLTVIAAPNALAEQVRLALSHHKVSNSVVSAKMSAPTKTVSCLTTLDQKQEICVPRYTTVNSHHTAALSIAPYHHSAVTIELNGSSEDNIIETLRSTGWYASVDKDVLVYNQAYPKQSQGELPTDPNYQFQSEYYESQDEHSDGLGILKAWELIDEQEEIGIAVLDGVFRNSEDLTFEGGIDLITIHDDLRQGDWHASQYELDTCPAHGTGVASVIHTEFGNDFQGVGVVDNVKMYAIDVLDCGAGYLTDVADGLLYLAKESVENTTPFTGNVTVANLSLGGPFSECPYYMQTAIDAAVNAGITVTISAGNSNIDAAGFTPTNCENAIIVGAQYRGDRTSFSNYGDTVDVMARGDDVLGLSNEETPNPSFWTGTSFSAPITAGVVALMQQKNPNLTPSQAKLALKTTARDMSATPNCIDYGCGNGLIDAEAAVHLAGMIAGASDAKFKFTLNEKDSCEQQWLVDHFGESAKLCELHTLDFGVEAAEGYSSKLYRSNMAEDTDREYMLETSSQFVTLTDVDTETYSYSYDYCDSDTCIVSNFTVDTTLLESNKPSACIAD